MSKVTKTQSISGFKVLQFLSKKAKDSEKIKIVLEADTDDIGTGDITLGGFLTALQIMQAGDLDIGISVLYDKEEDE